MPKGNKKMADQEMETGWRLRLGTIILVASFCSPILIPLVTSSNLNTEWKTALSGLLAFGIPELGAIVAVAIMGKPGFEMIKSRVLARLKHLRPAETVSLTRHRIGLLMFCLPLLCGWLEPYVRGLFFESALHWSLSLTFDLIFIASFFVLGGGFWEKIRALFLHGESALVAEMPKSVTSGTETGG
jgi:hypothetical protein